MRVLVCGATGFLGREAVRAFSRAGHEVRGLVRRADREALVLQDGGQPVPGSLLDPPSLERALEGCDLAVHLAIDPADPQSLADHLRVYASRVEGARHLSCAARHSRVRRVLVGSGYWVYGSTTQVLDEETPVAPMGFPALNYETEEVSREAMRRGDHETVIVRPGMVYGHGSWFAGMVQEVRESRYRYVSPGAQKWSFVSLRDFGSALVAVAERAENGETYVVADDEPLEIAEATRHLAHLLRVPPPTGISFREASALWGEMAAYHLSAHRAASNRKLRRVGWVPRDPNFREGVRAVLQEMGMGPDLPGSPGVPLPRGPGR